MNKLFAMITLVATLMAANIADAKFSDEYRAKYPRRVKVVTDTLSSGQKSVRTTYTLFKSSVNNRPFKMVLTDCNGFLKFCHLIYGVTNNSPAGFTTISWGDGTSVFYLKPVMAYTERRGRGEYFHYVSAKADRHDLDSMERAVILNVHGGGSIATPILDQSHKKWKDWLEAIDAAEKIMNER